MDYLKTDHLVSDLKGRSVRGAIVTLIGQVLRVTIGLLSTMILARLLSPTDYGIVAMVTAVTGFVAVIKDGGLSIATIQQTTISEAQVSTLFWVNVGLGFLAAVIIAFLSPAVAWFYNRSDLLLVTVAMAIPFVLSGLSVQHQALLRRQMRFRALTAIEVIGSVTSLSVAVSMALNGFHYWSLIAMVISSSMTNFVLVWIICRWRPKLPQRGAGVREMLVFGGELTAINFIGTLSGAVDKALLGRFLGADVAGQYSRAQGLLYQPIMQIMPALETVGLPALSRLKSQPDKFDSTFSNLMKATVFASSFMASFMFSGADLLVLFFLGSQWTESVNIFRCFVGPIFTTPISTLCFLNLTAQGKSKQFLHWGVFNNVVLIFSVFIGLFWGAKGVAAAISISSVGVRVPYLYHVLGKVGPTKTAKLWSIVAPGAILCIVATTLLLVIRAVAPFHGVISGLILIFGLNVLIHASAAIATPWGRGAMKVAKNLFFSLKSDRRKEHSTVDF